ncbi:sensor histidine kinase [Arcobacter sp. YIC-464]|uniref:sensor histidine kinase n=1 Tax=Arcobacter sp. YIC-464 TaxID=3376631 RepID=UPI003C1E3265
MKLLVFFILFLSNLFASDINKYENINSFKILYDDEGFKNITYKEYKNKKLKDFTIKLGVNKNTLLNKVYYLTIFDDKESLVSTNISYKNENQMKVIRLDSSTPKNLYFKYSYFEAKKPEFRFNVISSFEYKYILPFEGILYGLAYGIIFSAFLYYLVIYFSTSRVCFLYYSCMQLFVLLSLIGFVYFSFQPYPKQTPQAFVDIFETAAFMFTFLFAKEILDAKRIMPIVNHILSFFVLINALDILLILIFKYSILYEYIDFYISFLVPCLAGIIALSKGKKEALFYTIGWFTLFVFVFSYEYDLIPLSGIYTIHIAAPLESLIFSFALAFMLKNLVKKQNEQEKMLIHKSKLASIGEMINNIAHQWRQPLMHLSYINMNLQMSSENSEFDKDFFVKKIKESNSQIKFMSKTIDDFRDFYQVEKQMQEFSVKNACSLAINILTPTLQKRNIIIDLDLKEEINILGYENEFAQVILNFLTNSIDKFIQNKQEICKIHITIQKQKNKLITEVCDNAGGIELENLDEVFDAYFTTKQRGSGIGLYMSRLIIKEHFKGDIKVSNTKNGACFKIII